MANITACIAIITDCFLNLFHRFIWPAGDIDRVYGKAVFIAGCDTGFGHLTALLLNKSGFHVFAGCLNPNGDGASRLIVKCHLPGAMTIVEIDVTSDESVRRACDEILAELRQRNEELHAVINNAGTASVYPIEWGSISDLQRQLEVNSIGKIRVTKQFLPLIRSSKGRIVNVNSLAGRHATPGLIGVCVSEAASLSFTEGLRREMYPFGVKVISVEPHIYAMPMIMKSSLHQNLDKMWSSVGEEVKKAYDNDLLNVYMNIPHMMQLSADRNIHQVPEAIRHAVMNKYPRHQYTVASWGNWFMQLIPLYAEPQEIREMIYNLVPYLVPSVGAHEQQVTGTTEIPPITFDLIDDSHTD